MKKIFALILFITGVVTVHAQQPVNGLELPYGVKVLDTLATDAWYGPYQSIEHALESVPEAVRKHRTVKIDTLEYWWRDGNADEDLILKTDTLAVQVPDRIAGQTTMTNYGAVPLFNIRRAGGTENSPSAITSGQSVQIRFSGYTGSGFNYGAMINAFANGNWSGANNGMDMSFTVKEAGTTTDVSSLHVLGTNGNAGSIVFGPYTAATARVQIRKNNSYSHDLLHVTTQDNALLWGIDANGNMLTKNPTASTGTAIRFDFPRTYGYSAAATGDITLDNTNFREGITQLLIHNDSEEPSFGSEFKKVGGDYVTGVNNYILMQSVKSNEILVTISQHGGGVSGVTIEQVMDSITNAIDTRSTIEQVMDSITSNVVWGKIPGTLSAQTDLQSALDAKTTTALTASTGTAIAFDIPRRYGTHASPVTGNITYNGTGAVVGQVQTMIHNDSSPPSWGAEFDIIGGVYIPNEDNKIMMFLVESGKVWVTISQTIE